MHVGHRQTHVVEHIAESWRFLNQFITVVLWSYPVWVQTRGRGKEEERRKTNRREREERQTDERERERAREREREKDEVIKEQERDSERVS